jgi:hypothetical protein
VKRYVSLGFIGTPAAQIGLFLSKLDGKKELFRTAETSARPRFVTPAKAGI